MRFFYLLIIALGFSLNIFAQVVVSEPQNPMEDDSIKIIFDATQGNRGLLNYTGVVYTHTGVITSTSNGAWSHVIGAWGNNTQQPALTRIGTNLYELVIGRPRQFYSVTDPNEHILKLAFVFRNAAGNAQTEDLFIEINYSFLKFNSPIVNVIYGDPLRSPVFALPIDTIDINVTSLRPSISISNLKLLVNNNLVLDVNNDTLDYKFISANYSAGINNITAIGLNSEGLSDTTSFVIMVNPPAENIAPPAGTQLGINYNSNNSVTLALFAPYKKFVYLIGSMNDWKVGINYFMKKYTPTPDSTIYWITLDNLTVGTEYPYQYLVDGEIRVADPYTEKVLDPWNDQYINSTTYPGLIPYPTNKTSHIVSVFQPGQTPYQWQVTNFQKPAKTDLVIYELLVRDFLSAHNYQTLADTLTYLKSLGVNAIELMPVMEFEGNESWGYNISFHLALDKAYGTKNAFKRFIDKAHQMGIAVILDNVLNHAFGQNSMVRMYWDTSNNRPAANSPWFNQIAKHDYNVGYDFNHESIYTQYYVDRVNKYWLEEFHIDGYRFDLSKGFTQVNTLGNTYQWGQYDQSRINILTRMANKIREVSSNSYVILEHFADNSEETVLSNNNMMLWGNMNYNYNEATMGWLANSDFTWGSYKARGWNEPNLVTFMESHDEERLMYKNIQYGNSSGTYNIKDLRESLNRMKLAAAFFFTIPGPKMIWQFGELGYDYSIEYNGRVGNKPIKWDYLSDPKRANLYKVFSALSKIKVNEPAFETTNYSLSLAGAFKRIIINHSDMDVVVAGNFDVINQNASPQFTRTGRWYDFFSGDSIDVTNTYTSYTYKPGEFHVYTTKKLETPEQGILLGINDENNFSKPITFNLENNYPNPFNPATTINYSIAKESKVKLSIYNALGENVRTLVNEIQGEGYYSTYFDASGLPSGIYFYKIEAGNYVSAKKMILMK